MKNKTILAPPLFFVSSFFGAQAAIIDIQELALFNYGESFDYVLEDDQVTNSYSDFSYVGFDVQFENNLNDENQGSFSWTVTNNGSQSILGLLASVFWDAELSQFDNSFTNESGEYVGNTTATSWEIDEPGYTSGDLIWNMLDFAEGDNQNALEGTADDVALSLGFYLEEFNVGDIYKLEFDVSEEDIGGLRHFDVDSGDQYFFNGFMTYSANPDIAQDPEIPVVIEVAEPSSFILIAIGLLGLVYSRRRSYRS